MRYLKLLVVLCACLTAVLAVVEFAVESRPNPYAISEQTFALYGDDALEIVGPVEVEVGELARLSVAQGKVDWNCIPETLDSQIFGENNQKFVISFRKPGVYYVVAAVAFEDQVKSLTHKITVLGPPEPPKPPPTPVDPVDPVDPDVPINVELDVSLVKLSEKWCKNTNSNKRAVGPLAEVFKKVGNEIRDGHLTTTGEIINRTAVLNQELDLSRLSRLMSEIQVYLTTQADSGKLDTAEQHMVVWLSIAEGLGRYAN